MPRGRRLWLVGMVTAAGVCLALGLSLPFMRLTKLAVLGYGAYGHSLISAVSALIRSQQYVLGGALLVLALLLPMLKLLYLVLLAALPAPEIGRSASQLRALDWLGRWSMHDLLAFAMAGALITSDPTVTQRAGTGAYLFATAVLIMALAYVLLPGEMRAFRLRRPAARAAHASSTRWRAFAVLVLLAAAAFVAGVTLPAVRLSTSYAGADLHSVAGLVWALYERGATVPCVALLGLAIVLPGLRLLCLLTLALARTLGLRNKTAPAASALGRSASADAMLLALMLAYLIAAGEADAALQPGVYALVASAGLTLIAQAWINLLPSAGPAQPPSLAARLAGLASAEPAAKL